MKAGRSAIAIETKQEQALANITLEKRDLLRRLILAKLFAYLELLILTLHFL